MAYAARVGLEIGADIIKLQPTGRNEDVEWAVESAGKCKVVLAVRVTNENIPTSKGQPIFMDVPDIGVFRMQCFCGFDEFAFTIDKSCFCCADCLGIVAKRELGGAEADMSQATWKL